MNLLAVFMFCHLFACLWHLMHTLEQSQETWVWRLQLQDASVSERYITSLYWITQTVVSGHQVITVGYGDIGATTVAERCMAVIAMFAGVIFFSLTVGSLTSLLSDLDKKNSLFDNKMTILDSIVVKHGIRDARLLQKVTLALRAQVYSTEENVNELLEILPKKHAVSLAKIVFQHMVENLKFFREMEAEVLLAVCPNLHPIKFSKGERIYLSGEHANEVYFIKSGSVGLAMPVHDEVFLEVKEGDYFGDIDIILGTQRAFSLVARTAVELLTLEKKHFVRVFFQEFKHLGKQIKQAALLRRAKQMKCFEVLSNILNKYSKTPTDDHKIKEQIMSEYMPFLNQDTFTETSLNFSPSFLERNRDYVPLNSKRAEEDVFDDIVASLHQNGRLPVYVKEADQKFDKIENLLKRAKAIIGGKSGAPLDDTAVW